MNSQKTILLNKIYLLNNSIYYSYLNLINNFMIYILILISFKKNISKKIGSTK